MIVRYWPAGAEATRTALRLAEERGQLVEAGRRGDLVRVVLRAAAVERAAPRQVPRHRWEYVAACSVALLAAGGALVWLLVEVVMLAARWLGAHVPQVLGSLGALLALMYLLGCAGVCPGVHCPGCRHR